MPTDSQGGREPMHDDELASADHRSDPPQPPDANADALEVSDRLRSRIRVLERAGTGQPFRHRIALIGAAELDGRRHPAQRSGAWPLLVAVYAHGAPHWLDPVGALATIRDTMFKEGAPPGTDRGLVFVLTRLARAGISPAAFATHVIMPRMGADADWRGWKSRHVWVLDAIAGLLIDLRSRAPWDGERLGSSQVLSDVALCKYVGRPLCRLSGARMNEQESHLKAWAGAWASFGFSSPALLDFLRRTVLPCLYRLSGRIDPEQLAPIGVALAGLERSLGRRLSAMGPAAAEAFLASAGLSDDFDRRMERRAMEGAGAWALARELRAYAELAEILSAMDAGPALLGHAAALGSRLDSGYLSDAVSLAGTLAHGDGAAQIRWHLDALARESPEGRATFIQAVRSGGGTHPASPYRAPPPEAERFAESSFELARALGLPALAEGREQLGVGEIRRAYAEAHPADAGLLEEMAEGLGSGADREWKPSDLARLDAPGEAFHELAVRWIVAGLGSGFSPGGLKASSATALASAYREAAAGTLVPARVRIALGLGGDDAAVDPAGKDAVRARVAVDFMEALAVAALGRDGDPDCGALFAELGKDAASARSSLDRLKADAPGDGKAIKGLEARLSSLDAVFEASRDLPLNAGDPRRLALAAHAAAWFLKPGDEASLAVVSGAARRWSADPAFSAIRDRLAAEFAPGFMGPGQALLLADAVDALCTACGADRRLCAVLDAPDDEMNAALSATNRLRGREPGPESMDAALRRCSGYQRLSAETAKWRDLLAKLGSRAGERRRFRAFSSRSAFDAYYGDMGGICLSSKPELIRRPGVMVTRLWDESERRIRGMSLMAWSGGRAAGARISRFWYAFAFNPLRSLTRGMGSRELMGLYLAFRAVAEDVSRSSGLPVLIPGIGTHGVVSNDPAFASLVVNYELRSGATRVTDASGFAIYYSVTAFADALVAIDPARPESYRARAELSAMGLLDDLAETGSA